MQKTKECHLKRGLAESNKSQNLNARNQVQKSNYLFSVPVLILGIVLAYVSNFIFVVEKDNQTDGHNPTAGNDSKIYTQSLQLKGKKISIIKNVKKSESDPKEAEPGILRHRHTCKYYLAKSRIPNSGLGIFTTADIEKGGQVGPGDMVIHANDLNPHFASALGVLLFDYAWDSSETGGQYEGQRVFSFVPGFGMAANGHQHMFNTAPNPLGAKSDNAALTRDFPGAGANSHYHDFTFHATGEIEAGSEILMDYGINWFNEREIKGRLKSPQNLSLLKQDIDWLRDHGSCLDNIRVGRSTKRHAGRGAFATRAMPAGSMVAPAPIVQISDRRSLDAIRVKQDPNTGADVEEHVKLLLLNYCFGNPKSSLLFFPYSPIVNFINHDYNKPNVELRWSTSSQHHFKDAYNLTLDNVREMKNAGLVLEFVATTELMPGDEIFLNYGKSFEDAWNAHTKSWISKPRDSSVGTAYTQDLNKLNTIRTQPEQRRHPYPDNVFTSCYYNHADSLRKNEKNHDGLNTWIKSNTIFFVKNLRPCMILDRHESRSNGHDEKNDFTYTVGILNRFGLIREERLPEGQRHIVTGVPRNAIKFSNKIYTTDQHMSSAFRHEIHLEEKVFPLQWQDQR